MATRTRTYALMDVPPEVFKLIKEKLEAAGYGHAIIQHPNGETHLDMDGIALVEEE